MKPRISVITLGVDDLETAVRFYRDGLRLPTEGIIGQDIEHGAVCFFSLSDHVLLAVWPRHSVAHDVQLSVTPPSPTDFTLGHNVRTPEEVDTVLAEAEAAGAHIIKPANQTAWGGYAGYFQDPDAHLWEVVWNPKLLPAD